jgi:hypothetical protein
VPNVGFSSINDHYFIQMIKFASQLKKMIKKILLLALSFVALETYAQSIQITPSYGYRFGGRVDVFVGNEFGYVKFNDSQSYGIDMAIDVKPGFAVNLSWFGQYTPMDFFNYGDISVESLGDIHINYFTIGGLYKKNHNGITPFGGLGLGVGVFSPERREYDTSTRMAMNLQAGAIFDMSHRVGLKIRAAMLVPFQFSGGGLFCSAGTGGSGCGVNVGASSSIIQGDISAGIVVNLGQAANNHHAPSSTSKPVW